MKKPNKVQYFIMTNFRLPVLLVFIAAVSYGYFRLYNLEMFNTISSDNNKAMLFFLISGLMFFLISLKMIFDILDIFIFQKGKDTLTKAAKRK